ncbi:MAG: 50S ribosomal protein L10 [Candidatus Colwellbacteria bacterium RIFCSPLOWO2_01_FULL_48_10]|uniref:Large ribosomal subunit protein uL10 n=1 Tax=Candidatus Colwellbacteria bacterium RIFCSPLOWO2_01_FULL_48_10 TaxID=1797690 RepID=A0A1G1Z520_9BACT|nr:MAG: 50S ribosomal protein L10 [Candidatus Colwellbacteria bacterium RIFCSPLOWO2_01_FULL_48_10]
MKTKAQKTEIVRLAEQEMKDAKFLVFADFSETPDEVIKAFRRLARGAKSRFHVIKKRLLGVALKKAGIEFNPKQFKSQVGTVFAQGDISEIAPVMYKFSKANANFKLLGALDLINKLEMPLPTLQAIGKLPSREVLLGQVLGGLTGPIRKLMYVLQEVAKGRK